MEFQHVYHRPSSWRYRSAAEDEVLASVHEGFFGVGSQDSVCCPVVCSELFVLALAPAFPPALPHPTPREQRSSRAAQGRPQQPSVAGAADPRAERTARGTLPSLASRSARERLWGPACCLLRHCLAWRFPFGVGLSANRGSQQRPSPGGFKSPPQSSPGCPRYGSALGGGGQRWCGGPAHSTAFIAKPSAVKDSAVRRATPRHLQCLLPPGRP